MPAVQLTFDVEDAEVVEGKTWRLVRGMPCCVVDGEVRTVTEVLGLDEGVGVRNGDWTDVRRENLIGVRWDSSKLGAGFSYQKRQDSWRASVTINGRSRYVCSAKTREAAEVLFVQKVDAVRERVIREEGISKGRARAMGRAVSEVRGKS